MVYLYKGNLYNIVSELPTATHSNLDEFHKDKIEAKKQNTKSAFCMIPFIQRSKKAKLNGRI